MMKNIFLDAGGVILDEDSHEKLRAKIISNILNEYKPGYLLEDYWQDVNEAVYRYVPRVYNYIIYKNVEDKSDYIKIESQYKNLWRGNSPELILMNGIDKVIPILSERFKVGILGQYGIGLKELLKESGLLQYFSFKDTQEQFNITKPDPRYFEQVLASAGVKSEESYMVGDRIGKDVIPAKQIGMKTVRIKTGLHKNQLPRVIDEIPDYEYDTVYGLLELCK